MRLVRLASLFTITLLLGASVALAQGDPPRPWEFSCRKWEERQWVACGASPFQMERRFLIGHSDGTEVGQITIVNRSGKHQIMEFVEISPACNADDPQQLFWFGDVGKEDKSAGPGEKISLGPYFVGRKRATTSHAPRPWVAPGTYEGTLRLRDKATGEEYRFSMTVYAYKPGR